MYQLRSSESITTLDLRELRALVAVKERGTFRQAAEELGYTQSALSHQVAALERALDRRLFTRPGGRGRVQLTPAGEVVYRRALRALGEVEAIGGDIFELVAQLVRIEHASHQLPVILAQLRQHVVRRDELRIIVRGPLQAGDVPD